MKDAIKALKAERKRLMGLVKMVDKTLKAAGVSERLTKRRRRATNAKAARPQALAGTDRAKRATQRAASPVGKVATGTKAVSAPLLKVASVIAGGAPAAARKAATPVQPAPSKVGARRPGSEQAIKPRRNVDDLLADDTGGG